MAKRKKKKKYRKNRKKNQQKNIEDMNLENKINNDENSDENNEENEQCEEEVDDKKDNKEKGKKGKKNKEKGNLKRQDDDTILKNIIEQISIQQKTLQQAEEKLKPLEVGDEERELIERINADIVGINSIRTELARFRYNLEAKAFYDTEILPLITAIEFLSFSSESFASATRDLLQITYSRSSKIKDSLELVYGTNDVSEKVLDVLECKMKQWLDMYKKC